MKCRRSTWCLAEGGHDYDCRTETELVTLRARVAELEAEREKLLASLSRVAHEVTAQLDAPDSVGTPPLTPHEQMCRDVVHGIGGCGAIEAGRICIQKQGHDEPCFETTAEARDGEQGPSEAWKAVSEDGSIGFDLRHDGKSLGAVTFAADGDVEIVIPKREQRPAEPMPERIEEGHVVLARGVVEDVCNGFANVRWDTRFEDDCVDLVPVDALRHERWTAAEIAKVNADAEVLATLFSETEGFVSVLESDLDRVKTLLGLDPVQDGIAQVIKHLERRLETPELTQDNAARCFRNGFGSAIDACLAVVSKEAAYWRDRQAEGVFACENIEGQLHKMVVPTGSGADDR